MGFRSIATLNGIVSMAYGVAGFVAPAALASVYGTEIAAREELVLRLLSASYFAFGILCWTARGVTEDGSRRAIALSGFAGWGLSIPVFALGQLAGYANALGWTAVGMQVAFTLAWGWTLLKAARPREQVSGRAL